MTDSISTALARDWVRGCRAELPLPGGGRTRERWSALTALCEQDVAAGRLVEAHADADAILAEVEGAGVARSEFWGVWAAEPPTPELRAHRSGDEWVLEGVKPWCSGASVCTHALVTARVDGAPRLFAAALHDGVEPLPSEWVHPGMAATDTRAVSFSGVPARAVGGATAYLERPGFWHGGIGVAACWLGAGHAVARPLVRRCAGGSADPHALAHLGAVDVALGGAGWALDAAAAEVDAAGPEEPLDSARHRAVRLRALVETAVDEAVRRVGRALGAAPLTHDAAHVRAVLDAGVYIRQSHAERDLAQLGALVSEHSGWCRR